jgi:hypothetical protein
MTDYFGGLKL